MLSAPVQAVEEERNPCVPSPCGPNSLCRTNGKNPSCTCLEGYVGSPPNCRPECVINPDCHSGKACINSKCRDPCPGSCGVDAECRVISHAVSCLCRPGYTGNPFVQCIPQKRESFCFVLALVDIHDKGGCFVFQSSESCEVQQNFFISRGNRKPLRTFALWSQRCLLPKKRCWSLFLHRRLSR